MRYIVNIESIAPLSIARFTLFTPSDVSTIILLRRERYMNHSRDGLCDVSIEWSPQEEYILCLVSKKYKQAVTGSIDTGLSH